MQKNSIFQDQKISHNIIYDLLEKNKEKGVSITELVELSRLTRSAVRIILAKFEGAGLVVIRPAGMTKLYFINN